MKKVTILVLALFSVFISFSQDTEAPTTPVNFQFIDNPTVQPDNISVQWEHATDNIGVATYEVYINGALEEIITYNGANTIEYLTLLNFPNGTYCLTILARDAAGNASPLSNQVCKNVNVIYQNGPTRPYLSGFLNYSGDDKAIEITNETFGAVDLSDYSIKVSYDGSGTWDSVYTFPSNFTLAPYSAFILAHPNFSLCTTNQIIGDNNHVELNTILTNLDGNDAIGIFKYDILYDVIGEPSSSSAYIATDVYIKRAVLFSIPSTSFDINAWSLTTSNGNCPTFFGALQLATLSTEDKALNSFQIYPNPANGNTLQFNTKNNQTIDTVSILDINGRNVLTSTTILNNQLDIQAVKQGIYFVKIQSGNNISTHKLIRQ